MLEIQVSGFLCRLRVTLGGLYGVEAANGVQMTADVEGSFDSGVWTGALFLDVDGKFGGVVTTLVISCSGKQPIWRWDEDSGSWWEVMLSSALVVVDSLQFEKFPPLGLLLIL